MKKRTAARAHRGNVRTVELPPPTNGGAEQPVTSAQLADHLQVTTRTLANYRAEGRIPFWRVTARNFRYRISDVERALS
jgi:hypothetical protein